jgi:hypothetical protein
MLLAAIFMLPFVFKDIRANTKRKFSDLKIFVVLALAWTVPGPGFNHYWYTTIHGQ